MPRQPKLRKKQVGQATYWYTEAGGATYFGNVEAVPLVEARNLFNDHIKSLSDGLKDSKAKGRSAGELMDLFLDWINKNRSVETYGTRRTACSRFGAFEVGQQKTRDLPANKVRSDVLAGFLTHLEKNLGLGAQTRRHYETSIKFLLHVVFHFEKTPPPPTQPHIWVFLPIVDPTKRRRPKNAGGRVFITNLRLQN